MTAGRRDFPLWSTLLLQFRPHFSFGRSEDKSRSIPNERLWKAKSNMKTKFLMAPMFLAAGAISLFKRHLLHLLAICVLIPSAQGQVLTHGPVVGGVTASEANVFVRTEQEASVALRYGTDPNLGTYLVSGTFQTVSTNDLTKIIPLASLTAETTYYMNVVVNGVPQSASPYPSFTTFAPSGTSRSFNFIVLTDFTSTQKLTSTVQTYASAAATSPGFAFIGGDFDHRNPQNLSAKRGMVQDPYDPNT